MFTLTGLSVTLAACALEDDELATVETPQAITSRGDTVVSPAIARAVAEAFTAQDGKLQKHVGTVSTMLDASGRTALYGVNFVEGGYVVISAEMNMLPILAFTDEGAIDFQSLPAGEDGMIGELRGAVGAIRTTAPGADAALDAARTERVQWHPYLDQIATRADVPPAELAALRTGTSSACDDGPCVPEPVEECTTTKKVVTDPLLGTAWAQGKFFNSEIQAAAGGPDGHALVGCPGVAAAQVMRFNKRGFGVSAATFEAMPGSVGATVAKRYARNKFLKDVAVGVNTQFGATLSTAFSKNVVAMLNSQGYSAYRSKAPYGIANVGVDEIKQGRPMILEGESTSGAEHMWVVDGVQEVLPGLPEGCKLEAGSVHAYFNHNFGHGKPSVWYADLVFGTYQYDRYLTTVKKK